MNFLYSFSLSKVVLAIGLSSLSFAAASVVDAEPILEAAVRSEVRSSEKIYVYGQVPRPNALRKGYVVFQKTEDKVVGAYYQPFSEFSCFMGDLENRELDVDFVSLQGDKLSEAQIALSNLHRLQTPGEVDRKVMNACRREVPQSL